MREFTTHASFGWDKKRKRIAQVCSAWNLFSRRELLSLMCNTRISVLVEQHITALISNIMFLSYFFIFLFRWSSQVLFKKFFPSLISQVFFFSPLGSLWEPWLLAVASILENNSTAISRCKWNITFAWFFYRRQGLSLSSMWTVGADIWSFGNFFWWPPERHNGKTLKTLTYHQWCALPAQRPLVTHPPYMLL